MGGWTEIIASALPWSFRLEIGDLRWTRTKSLTTVSSVDTDFKMLKQTDKVYISTFHAAPSSIHIKWKIEVLFGKWWKYDIYIICLIVSIKSFSSYVRTDYQIAQGFRFYIVYVKFYGFVDVDVVLDTVRWQIIISTKFDKGKMSSFCQFMVKDAKDSHLFNNHQMKIKKRNMQHFW